MKLSVYTSHELCVNSTFLMLIDLSLSPSPSPSLSLSLQAYRDQALRAIIALNGTMFKGRELRVRYAASSCSVKVSNLHPMVSNELLYNAFSQFGEVEYAVVVTDERGKSLCHGVVDYAKKSQALSAIDSCRHGVFLLTK